MKIKRIVSLLMLFAFFTVASLAQNSIKLTVASSPPTVSVGEPFRIIYTVNAKGGELTVPDFQFFKLLAGPFTSTSSNFQMINGKTSSSTSVSYTYTLISEKKGTFKVPPATIVINGKNYKSNALTITVQPQHTATKQVENSRSVRSRGLSPENLFIRTIVSDANVYEQEGILVTYKMYTTLDVTQFTEMDFPDYNGFLKQEVKQGQNRQLSYENYKGRNYGTIVLYQVLLFPQHAGSLHVNSAKFKANVRVQLPRQISRSIFDDFFDSYEIVSHSLVAPGVKINVKPLPTPRPASFSGMVGHFTIQSKLSNGLLKTNEAANIRLTISGSGNMKLMGNPTINYPESFDTYDPKVENNFSTRGTSIAGKKTIEYLFIPRHIGEYEIPSSKISYFDLSTKTYKTLATPTYKVEVERGEGNQAVVGNYTQKEDVTTIGKDIRYIATDKLKLYSEDEPILWTITFWNLILIPLLIAIILFFYIQKRMKESANISLMRNKRASKVALQRLKKAQKMLKMEKKTEFYAEIMKAIWSYLSDKLQIDTAALNKENIQIEMEKANISAESSMEVISLLNDCEFAAYAPTQRENDTSVYDRTMEAISHIETELKKR